MPTGAIDLHQAVRARCYMAADFGKMFAHGFKIDRRHDDPRTHTARGAHGAEYVSPGVAAITRCSRPAAAGRPHAGLRALLTDSGFILPPDLQRFAGGMRRQGGLYQRSEVFLCVCWAEASCSGWKGRAASLRNASLASSLPMLRSWYCTAKSDCRRA